MIERLTAAGSRYVMARYFRQRTNAGDGVYASQIAHCNAYLVAIGL